MGQCDICEEMGMADCENCYLGNPCLNCPGYDAKAHECMVNGECAEAGNEQKGPENDGG